MDYLDILNQWESKGVEKTMNLLAEKIAIQFLIDQGFNKNDSSQEKHTLKTAGRQIRELIISKTSAMKNFDIDIESDTVTGEIKIAEQTLNTESEDQQTDSQKEPVAAEELSKESNKPSENEVVTLTLTLRHLKIIHTIVKRNIMRTLWSRRFECPIAL